MGDPGGEGGQDADVIRASLEDPHRFGLIFERHAPALHRYVARRVDPSRVDDVLSETFVAAFRNRHRYDVGYPDARPWLYGIATNMLRHQHRSESRRRSLADRLFKAASPEVSEDDPASEALAHQERQARGDVLRSALAQMDVAHVDVLTLFTGPQLSYEEIARALDIPIGTVRSRMSRGRAQLRELLTSAGQYLGDDVPIASPSLEEEHRP
jgi:RNA polymerase sigma factor (sigma-70 family)